MTTHLSEQEIIHTFLVACMSEQEGANMLEMDEEEVMESLADQNEIERCEQCSWWCEIHELDEDNICEDCQE